MSLAVETLPKHHPDRHRLLGSAQPRLAPPLPAKSDIKALRATAEAMRLTFMPWQDTAGRYIEARQANGKHLFREVLIEVARQNGKTTLVKPVIVKALRAGLRIMHLAQTRELPREMFSLIADALSAEPDLFPRRRGKIVWPRYAQGQEEIVLNNGGRYRIAAAKTGGARGWANDVVIIDELREMTSFDIISAVQPTLMMSPDPLMIYLSNAGDDHSVVLNAVRSRADTDANLAVLEWSAAPERTADDRAGWTEANPAIGHFPSVLPNLEASYMSHLKAGTLPMFETENLCRSVPTLMPRVVADIEWQQARGEVTTPDQPTMGIKVDPEGRRASAVIAWMTDSIVHVRSFAEDTLSPLDVDAFAEELKPLVRKHHITTIGFDPWTDRDLARHFPNIAKAINGADYVAAGERFVRAVKGGTLVHDDDGTIATDLQYTVRRETPNGWYATRAEADRPTTAGEAAIRAVYLATNPSPKKPSVH